MNQFLLNKPTKSNKTLLLNANSIVTHTLRHTLFVLEFDKKAPPACLLHRALIARFLAICCIDYYAHCRDPQFKPHKFHVGQSSKPPSSPQDIGNVELLNLETFYVLSHIRTKIFKHSTSPIFLIFAMESCNYWNVIKCDLRCLFAK